jgi:hypothetical protein
LPARQRIEQVVTQFIAAPAAASDRARIAQRGIPGAGLRRQRVGAADAQQLRRRARRNMNAYRSSGACATPALTMRAASRLTPSVNATSNPSFGKPCARTSTGLAAPANRPGGDRVSPRARVRRLRRA